MVVGVVLIGRNEGQRLIRALDAARAASEALVYVDSGSDDQSVEAARARGADVIELDRGSPFTAARARNAGWRRLVERRPDAALVQFIDGDCELEPGWIARGASELAADPGLAAVCGRRRERHPQYSVFNRLIDLEWDTPIGEAESCGGDALMRVAALRAVGGFDDSAPSAEEPELCARLGRAGWRVRRIDSPMTVHDADLKRLGQWWRREVRTGYGGLNAKRAYGLTLFDRPLRAARRWVLGWPAAVALLAGAGGAWAGVPGSVVGGAAGAALLPVAAARLAVGRWRRGLDARTAVAYGVWTMLAKAPQALGQVLWWRDRWRGRGARLVEYKSATPAPRGGAAC